VDYNDISATILPEFKEAEITIGRVLDDKKKKKLEKTMLLHPKRIEVIAKCILDVFNAKTHRNENYLHKKKNVSGFNAMLAVQSIDAAKLYYEALNKLQEDLAENKRLRIATIYSFSANEVQAAIGEIADENFEPSALDSSAKEFLDKVMVDYNVNFKTNFSTEGTGFQNYYKDLSQKVKAKEIDLLIVVGMFLTGFDAPTLNTLFVDKNLRYHGLIQAFSRTNRILNKVKTFGNIVCFRDLEQATNEAISIFGDKNSINVILEKSYKEYMEGFTDEITEKTVRGYKGICDELLEKFPDPTKIYLDIEKKEFVQLFGELLKSENILKNFDEFEEFEPIISEGQMQDMRSVYVDIKEEIHNRGDNSAQSEIDFSDVEFQVDLLKTEEINLDYILALILKKSQDNEDMETMKADIHRIIRSSIGTREKEGLVISFIENVDFSKVKTNEDILSAFYEYAKKEKENCISELVENEKLKDGSKRFIEKSIEKGFAPSGGAELDELLPPTSRRAGAREAKKQSVLEKIQKLVSIFIDI
jgi:type I restriction enzyme R subunit